MGENSKLGMRPSGCGGKVNNNCTGCGIYPSFGKTSRTWGMPSGHAQITSFAATYWTLYIWSKYKNEKDLKIKKELKVKAIVSTILMWCLSFLVWTQRVYSECHNIPQIIGGVIFGVLFGFLSYRITS